MSKRRQNQRQKPRQKLTQKLQQNVSKRDPFSSIQSPSFLRTAMHIQSRIGLALCNACNREQHSHISSNVKVASRSSHPKNRICEIATRGRPTSVFRDSSQVHTTSHQQAWTECAIWKSSARPRAKSIRWPPECNKMSRSGYQRHSGLRSRK